MAKVLNWPRWRSEVCSCKECYDKVETPLIFEFNGQKIMFISESPWDFPSGTCKTPEDFVKVILPQKLSCVKKGRFVPYNIFEFLQQTFRVGASTVQQFLKTIYWTHIAKKTLKKKRDIKEKERCALMCLSRTRWELEKVKPELLVIATSLGLKLLFRINLNDAFKLQKHKLEKRGELLTNADLTGHTLFRKSEYKIAVFPNPSPKNMYWKPKIYKENEGVIKKLLELIHGHLPRLHTKQKSLISNLKKHERMN